VPSSQIAAIGCLLCRLMMAARATSPSGARREERQATWPSGRASPHAVPADSARDCSVIERHLPRHHPVPHMGRASHEAPSSVQLVAARAASPILAGRMVSCETNVLSDILVSECCLFWE
jgi:hypothetical protein